MVAVVDDFDGDGIPDTLDTVGRIVLMEGARVLDAYMSRRKMLDEQAASHNREVAQAAQARLRAEATQSRFRLGPVMGDTWWARADLETIGLAYADAKAWDGVDPSFAPFVERIEERAKALHDVSPEQILDAVKAKERVPLTVDEARHVAAQNAPQWYRLHEDLTGDGLFPGVRVETEERLVADMTRLRDTGRLDTDSAKLDWARFTDHAPALRAPNPGETFDEVRAARVAAAREHWDHTAESRAGVSVPRHPDGVVVARPMSVGEARAFAEEFAPEWFRFGHEQSVPGDSDVAESAHVNDQMRYAMEHLRDTGTMGHPYAASMRAALVSHPEVDTGEEPRDMSSEDRLRYGASPHGRPLSDAEALELMRGYAPDWYVKPTEAALAEGTMLSDEQRAGTLDAVRSDMTRLRDLGILDTENAKTVWASQQDGGESVWDSPRPNEVWVQTAKDRPALPVVPVEVRERFGGVVAPPEGERPPTVHSGPYAGPSTDVPRAERKPGWDDPKRRAEKAERLRGMEFSESAVKADMVSDLSTAKRGGFVEPGGKHQKKARQYQDGQSRKKRLGR